MNTPYTKCEENTAMDKQSTKQDPFDYKFLDKLIQQVETESDRVCSEFAFILKIIRKG